MFEDNNTDVEGKDEVVDMKCGASSRVLGLELRDRVVDMIEVFQRRIPPPDYFFPLSFKLLFDLY